MKMKIFTDILSVPADILEVILITLFGEKIMKENGKQLALWGVVLQFGFLIGFAGTVIGMIRAFAEVTKNSEVQPQTLPSDISLALYTTAGGMILSLIGVVLLLVALFGAKYRASWFKTAMWILAVLWLFSIPVGTILGIIVMIYLSKHSNDFADPLPGPYGSPATGSPVRSGLT